MMTLKLEKIQLTMTLYLKSKLWAPEVREIRSIPGSCHEKSSHEEETVEHRPELWHGSFSFFHSLIKPIGWIPFQTCWVWVFSGTFKERWQIAVKQLLPFGEGMSSGPRASQLLGSLPWAKPHDPHFLEKGAETYRSQIAVPNHN